MTRPRPFPPVEQVRDALAESRPRSLTVTLPMPPACLSPNARAHWAAIAKARKATKEGAREATAAAIRGRFCWGAQAGCLPWLCARIGVVVRGPSADRMDADNLLARCKPVWDGIAAALGMNDRDFTFQPVRFEARGTGGGRNKPVADPTDIEVTVTGGS